MNFDRAVQALCDAGVEFIIIGGWSAILHGSAHVTTDLDIFFARRKGNLSRLVEALAPYHPRPADLPEGLPFVWDEATLRNGTIFTLTTELGRIDLLGEVSGVDKRADIWAYGVVLFEMLTGREMFSGETMSDALAAVLKADMDWSALPPETPAPIRRLLRRRLERDRKKRLRD